ncbi:MAG: hypothetical protein CVT95_04715 [Bacteroidetes bacterium HGW-Bacteroidetes-12]|nr:MAG: hypothetical protein CVT95_04715 [Bacteroidetes bacterium HGW-Bacteroidetes-12]
MKKIILFAVIFQFVLFNLNAQNIGINATGLAPAASAGLDVDFTNKGLLVPRVALTALNAAGPIAAPATSLLVYNTATAGVAPNNVTPGYYYWNGTAWVKFNTGGDAWQITGNANTTFGTHFLGTTNAQGVDFRTNNITRLRIPNAYQVWANANGTAALPFYSWANDPNTGMSSLAADQLNWSTGGAERLRLTNTQLATTFDGTAAVPAYSWTTDPNMGMYRIGTDILGFSTNGVERMQIIANGQVGVNGAAPVGDMFATTANGTNTFAINGYTAFNGIGVFGIRLAGSTGTWGAVQGELIATVPNNSNGVSGLVNNVNHRGVTGQKPAGGLQWGGLFLNDLGYTGFFGAASDERFKKDVVKIENVIEDLMKLKTYKYHYTEPELGGDHIYYYGFMAQDIEEIFPDMVQEKDFTPSRARSFYNGHDKNLKIKAVSTISLIPILTQATQEQQIIIEAQNAKIEALEKMVLELQKAVENK